MLDKLKPDKRLKMTCCPNNPSDIFVAELDAVDGKTQLDDVRRWLSGHPEESALAYSYAYASNEAGSAIHELNDPIDRLNPYAQELCDAWSELSEELFEMIKDVLERKDTCEDITGLFKQAKGLSRAVYTRSDYVETPYERPFECEIEHRRYVISQTSALRNQSNEETVLRPQDHANQT